MLISGKEALKALADGQEVELQVLDDENWYDSTQWTVGELLCFKGKFRLKPRTISINNIEVPAPFKPKEGDVYWYLHSDDATGYSCVLYDSSIDDLYWMQFGAWRTEEEIKQVVEALRSVFGGKQ